MSYPSQAPRLTTLAAVAAALVLVLGLARPDPVGEASEPRDQDVALLVPLTGPEARSALTGPRAPALTSSQLVPTSMPPELERLAAKVLPRGAPGQFPVAGPFNWGQEGARFGAGRGGRAHGGQDLFGRTGARLLAVRDGVVVAKGEGGGRGNYVAIHDPPARRTYVYLHLRRPAPVRSGQRVRAGRQVGELGCTGSCFGDHLHFEIRRGRGADGEPLDPMPDLRRWARSSGALPTLPPGAH